MLDKHSNLRVCPFERLCGNGIGKKHTSTETVNTSLRPKFVDFTDMVIEKI